MPKFEGAEMFQLMERLFPICRSITGNGVRQTLAILGEFVDNLKIHEVPSGTHCFDWTIPPEWNIREAFIEDESGHRIVDFKTHNLHILNYSTPVDGHFDLEELKAHLYTLPSQPDAIPYKTSYFKERWGFCMSHNQFLSLKPGVYRVKIDSDLLPGSLTFADRVLEGAEKTEILISTYVCHPSMANNELSGPVLAVALYRFLASRQNRFTYRFVFVPETIGAIAYLSKHSVQMKLQTHAGFQLTCVGDDRDYSYLPSRAGNTIADRVALHVLNKKVSKYTRYTFLERGSDERQYCAPGIDLPVVSMPRTRYGSYPEYHTSLDNMELVSEQGLNGALEVHKACLLILENNRTYRITTLGEPQLGKRNLRDSLGASTNRQDRDRIISQLIAYCDGEHDLIDLAETLGEYALDLVSPIEDLLVCGLLKEEPCSPKNS